MNQAMGMEEAVINEKQPNQKFWSGLSIGITDCFKCLWEYSKTS